MYLKKNSIKYRAKVSKKRDNFQKKFENYLLIEK